MFVSAKFISYSSSKPEPNNSAQIGILCGANPALHLSGFGPTRGPTPGGERQVGPKEKMDKERILSEIKRTAEENGGVPLGIDRFKKATGIRKEDWYGIYWAKWSDAQKEAGFEPNQFSLPSFDEKCMI